jgi:hypothetical protein
MPDRRPTSDLVPYVTPDTPRIARPAHGRAVIRVGLIVLAASIIVCLSPFLLDWGKLTPIIVFPALACAALGLVLILNGLLDLIGGRR